MSLDTRRVGLTRYFNPALGCAPVGGTRRDAKEPCGLSDVRLLAEPDRTRLERYIMWRDAQLFGFARVQARGRRRSRTKAAISPLQTTKEERWLR